MDQDQDESHEESFALMDQDKSHVNLLMLPTELLVYIISFLSSLHDKVKLRYVSRWLRYVIDHEGTPSLWREFVWPYCDSREECSVKEVLKVCGQHIKVLSFPYSRVTSTRLVEMLQYCSNVQHLSLPSTKLDPKQLRMAIHHMGCLQTLEVWVNGDSDIKQLLLNTGQLREFTIISLDRYCNHNSFCPELSIVKRWNESQFRPPNLNVTVLTDLVWSTEELMDYATQLTTIPTGTTANFKLYIRSSKVPLNFSPTLPYFQLKVEGSGQVTIPYVKLRDFGILGLSNDVMLMTHCQYGGRTLYMVRYVYYNYIVNKIMDSTYFVRCGNLSCATHFYLFQCFSLCSGHLQQLAIACPNLQRLNLQDCYDCLESLQGLQAVASHCHNLQGLNLLGICVTKVEDQIQLWEILSNMKLTHLGVAFCVLTPEAANKEKLICLYQKCWTNRGIQCSYSLECCLKHSTSEDVLMLSYFPSLNYIYLDLCPDLTPPTIVQDVINNCAELNLFYCDCSYHLSLNLSHNNHNLQQLYIHSPNTDVPDHFMTSVSAHGGLVHVVMRIGYLTFGGITSLVRNSPKLITLHLCVHHEVGNVENFNASLKKLFWNRKLFTIGHYKVDIDIDWNTWFAENRNLLSWEQGSDLLPLWEMYF